ncbi:large subunit ribosomal protein L6e [Babesia microti strain RI]|uniref:Large subunit ribosomal protein L6e n=1 Tax=Babesia microti (strain RI) TaxID=1133968 RepID=I7IGF4_BABMR|nr:large subunit ribosomal protein L6e [Babesia microti strain RI]CCF73766.1 large subunit ribosomal protein L6e [Babesia microti strain RI]|eukprot:XP_012648375.1 large subunit ribosomal protein L6e [Babesia microti strain RI]
MSVGGLKVKLNRKKTIITRAGHSKLVGRKYASAPKFRSSLQVGTILILLSGKFKGKRCVLLKRLTTSGLLLVTGPFLVNGIPLRRVNPRYVIATSTNVFNLEGIEGEKAKQSLEAVISKFEDKDFQKTPAMKMAERNSRRNKKDSDDMFIDETNVSDNKVITSEEQRKRQDLVDNAITPFLSKVPLLVQYLKTRFSLKSGMYPHLLKF